jgi:hypothetical protein
MNIVNQQGKDKTYVFSIFMNVFFYQRNSGDRIACGVIGIRSPGDRLPAPPQPQRIVNEQRPMSFVPFRQQAPSRFTR